MNFGGSGKTNAHCNLRKQPSTDSEVVSELDADRDVITGDTVEGGHHEGGNKWIEVQTQIGDGLMVEGYVAANLIR